MLSQKFLKLKVCGMKSPENVQQIAQLSVDFLGFIFYARSPRYAEELPVEVVLNLSRHIRRVGVFVDATMEEILSKVQKYSLDMIQLHGKESPAFCQKLKEKIGCQVIKVFGIDEKFQFVFLKDYLDCTDFYLFDTSTPQHGGSGMRFSWNLLKNYPYSKPYFLSGGIAPEHVSEIKALHKEQPFLYAVDINSRFETSPGIKNVHLVERFLKELQTP